MASREPVADQVPYEELRKLGYLDTAFDGKLVRPAAKAYVDYPHLTGVGQPVQGVHPIAVRRAAAKLAPILREYGVTLPYLPEEPDDWAWTEASVELIQALVEGGFVMPSVDDDVSNGEW